MYIYIDYVFYMFNIKIENVGICELLQLYFILLLSDTLVLGSMDNVHCRGMDFVIYIWLQQTYTIFYLIIVYIDINVYIYITLVLGSMDSVHCRGMDLNSS